MSGSVSGLGSNLAGIRSQLGPQNAALGVSRGEEANLVQEAAASNSKLADNSGGRSEIAKG